MRQIDFDGTETFSKIVTVSKPNDKSIFVFPNPTKDKLHIQSPTNEPMDIRIFNQLGQLVHTQKGLVSGVVDMSGLANGVYEVVVGDLRRRVVPPQYKCM